MIELAIGVVLGGMVSWIVSHTYYKKSSTEIPDWAKPIIEKLPNNKPTKDQLLKLFEEELISGNIRPDPILGYVACPKCKANATDFESTVVGNNDHTIVIKTCPHCGWSEDTEV
tara:strand:- start:15 stop:356 length:342 start_codon:yes stop_codon:yes gene_type:complete